MSLPRTVFPLTLSYGTVELDHAGMVQGLKDPEADEAVRGIVGKKYLVWIHLIGSLLMDWDDPCPYLVDIVTQSPRRVDGSRGVTADMFVPIFPNTDPDGKRPPVYPNGPGPDSAPFPRRDCSHWTDSEVWVAFKRIPEGLDNASAYRLPCEGLSLLRATCSEDTARIWGIKAQQASARSRCSSHHPLPDSDGPSPQVSESCPPQDGGDGICADAPPTLEWVDDRPGSGTSVSDDNPFTDTFVPLAKLSFDIGWISQTGSLPDVYSFFEEREQIKRIIKRAQSRRRTAFMRRAAQKVKLRWSVLTESFTCGPFGNTRKITKSLSVESVSEA